MRKKKIIELYAVQPRTGEIGIEIEMEGEKLMQAQDHGIKKHGKNWPWVFKMDGSLRGESCEWVLHK
ncbi:MAG: hypothetical protein MN733_37830, partial [Nitrososphaera sp.]|nr:hypothetical protein [Nitrososphaera sp.]